MKVEQLAKILKLSLEQTKKMLEEQEVIEVNLKENSAKFDDGI